MTEDVFMELVPLSQQKLQLLVYQLEMCVSSCEQNFGKHESLITSFAV